MTKKLLQPSNHHDRTITNVGVPAAEVTRNASSTAAQSPTSAEIPPTQITGRSQSRLSTINVNTLQQAARNESTYIKLKTLHGICMNLFTEFSNDQSTTNADRIQKYYNTLIREYNNTPDDLRKKVISTHNLMNYYALRGKTISKTGAEKDNLKKYKDIYNEVLDIRDQRIAMANDHEMHVKIIDDPKTRDIRDRLIDASNKVLLGIKKSISDIEKAIELTTKPTLISELNIYYNARCQEVIKVRTKQVTTLEFTGHLHSELKHLSPQQKEVLNAHNKNIYKSLIEVDNAMNGLKEKSAPWPQEFIPILKIFSDRCLDYTASLIDFEIPKIPRPGFSKENIESTQKAIDQIIDIYADLSSQIIFFCSSIPTKKTEETNQSQKTPDNHSTHELNTPPDSQTHSDGNASALSEASQQEPEKSVSNSHDPKETDSYDDSAVNNNNDHSQATTLPSTKTARSAGKILKSAKDALSVTNIDDEIIKHRKLKGSEDPGAVIRYYNDSAAKLNKRAAYLRKLASEIASHPQLQSKETMPADSISLQNQLVEQANKINKFAAELCAKETHWSLMKASPVPEARHWATLLSEGQIAKVLRPKKLPTEDTPNQHLYEMTIIPKHDKSNERYAPVYVHIHTTKEMTISDFENINSELAPAVHMKSVTQRTLGKTWEKAQHQQGNYNVKINRSPVDHDLLKKLIQLSFNA